MKTTKTPAAQTNRKSHTIKVPVTVAVWKRIKRSADRKGVSVAEWFRTLANREIHGNYSS